MVERNPKGELVAMAALKIAQARLEPLQRPHCVGEHHDREPALEALLQHVRQGRVHERLAAREADLLGAPTVALDLVEECRHIRAIEIDQAVVPGARFDVAIAAGDVAERAGVEPERPQVPQRHAGARLAVGGEMRIFEFFRAERRDIVASIGPQLREAHRPPRAMRLSRRPGPIHAPRPQRNTALADLPEQQHVAARP